MSRNRVLEVADKNVTTPQQCPLSHRIARHVSTTIIVLLCFSIIAVSIFLMRDGA